MSDYIVIEHVKDDAPDLFAGVEDPIREDGTVDQGKKLPGGVYRLAVGVPIYEDVVVPAVFDPDTGDVVDEERTERVLTGYEDVRDFVFAEADKRWAGKSADQVAAAQRGLVADALAAEAAAPDPNVVDPMPGIGESLS